MGVWAHGVSTLGKIATRHPHQAYAGLGVQLQIKCKYMQRTNPVVDTLVVTIEEARREIFFPAIFRGEEVNADFQKILGHSVKHGGLGVPYPQSSLEIAYNTSKADSWELVGSLLVGTDLKYSGHRACISKRHPQSAYAVLGVSFQLEWQYLD